MLIINFQFRRIREKIQFLFAKQNLKQTWPYVKGTISQDFWPLFSGPPSISKLKLSQDVWSLFSGPPSISKLKLFARDRNNMRICCILLITGWWKNGEKDLVKRSLKHEEKLILKSTVCPTLRYTCMWIWVWTCSRSIYS